MRATAIAVGGAHTCALLTDGTVRCWGANYRGQLGDGTTTFSSAPVRVEGLSDIVAIAAGDRHTCALRREGTVWCWGANDFGQLGKPGAAAGLASAFGFSPDKSTRPLAVAALADVIAIAAGETHVLALTKRGESFFWGQLTSITSRRPDIREPFKLPLPAAMRIAAGAQLDCAWTGGRAFCWGPDLHWLGQETKDPFALSELQGAGGLAPFAVGHGHACGVDPQRSVRCWGEKESLGNGEPRSYAAPIGRAETVGGLTDVVELASRWQTCAVVADGRVACWGGNNFFHLGDGILQVEPRPVWVAGVSDAVEAAVGESSTCIRTRNGQVRCWGENGYGQLGDATTEASATPTQVRFCANAPEPIFPGPDEGVPLLAALQRGSCMGSCPVYSVRVYADGTVIYRGDWHVRVRGGRRTQLSPADLDALRSDFRRSDFLGLQYQCRFASTDASSARVFFAERGKARLINHYHGCEDSPSDLTNLENEIDRIIGTDRWVAGADSPMDIGAMEKPLSVPGVTEEPDERHYLRTESLSDTGGPNKPLSKVALVKGMSSVKGKIADCYARNQVPGLAMVNVVIAPDGKVSTATVVGRFAGSPTATCVEAAVKTATFPPSTGLTTPYPFSLR